MTKTPAAPKKAAPIKSTAGKALEAAAKPVEALAGAIVDPLATAIKRAAKKAEQAKKADGDKS